jgi:hypothetical protein
MFDEEIWANHLDLFDDEVAELKSIGARVMGRKMNKIAKRNIHLYNRIYNILEVNTADWQNSRMAEIMVTYFDNTVEENRQLLTYLKQGFTE